MNDKGPMKIAFIADRFPSLSETFILNQVTGLIDLGCDVTIFARSKSEQDITHRDFQKYRLDRKIHYLHPMPKNKSLLRLKSLFLIILNLFRDPFFVFRAVGCLLKREQGFSHEILYYALSMTGHKFDVLNCHFGWAGIVGASLKKMGLAKAAVTFFHGSDLSTYTARYGWSKYEEVFGQMDALMPISNYWRQKLIDNGASPGKIIVHRMGIDTDKFCFSPKHPPQDPVKFVTVARLVEKKGIEYSMKAVAKVAARRPIEYHIAGDGPELEKLKSLAKQLNADSYIHFHGALENEQIAAVLGDCHVFVLSSVTAENGDMEGIPVALMEAMAAGLVVVSTRHSGIPELIEEGKTGLLADEKNSDQLAEKILHLLDCPELWGELTQNARQKVCSEFAIEKLNRMLFLTFQEIVEQSG